ncbi:MAG: CIA30 family protein [Lutibacter sp.]|nr:CIA30 family protein [Lutibacter sp.]MDT8416687.1 CIA30 family protein [Lutibacter sp.]
MVLTHLIMMVSLVINSSMVIFDFNKESDISNWKIVNDAVMGGQSSSKFYLNDEGYGVFKGKVSLENNGGFASLRHRFHQKKISDYKKAIIHLKGDGKRYQFRAKTNKEDQQAYTSYFETTGQWQNIELKLSALEPTFRGRKLNMPNFPADELEELGFMIANKVNENFELVIDKIVLE